MKEERKEGKEGRREGQKDSYNNKKKNNRKRTPLITEGKNSKHTEKIRRHAFNLSKRQQCIIFRY